MNLKLDLGNVVRRRRTELGLSQTQLAERMRGDVQQADISRIERGHLPWPRPDLLKGLAEGLSMGPLELITLSGWMSEAEYQHYRAEQTPAAEKPLAILGPGGLDDGLTRSANALLAGRFRTLAAFDGGTLLDTIAAQAPELVIVSQDCPRVELEQVEIALDSGKLSTNIIVVGHRRAAVPRDIRFHYLKAPVTPAAMGSLLGAMGYGRNSAA